MAVRRKTCERLLACACSAGTLGIAPVRAQSPPARGSAPVFPVEVWGVFHAEVGGGSGEVESRYVPQVTSAPGAEGSAGQVLALDPGAGRATLEPREVAAVMALGPVTLSPRRLALTIGVSLR